MVPTNFLHMLFFANLLEQQLRDFFGPLMGSYWFAICKTRRKNGTFIEEVQVTVFIDTVEEDYCYVERINLDLIHDPAALEAFLTNFKERAEADERINSLIIKSKDNA